MSTVISLRLSPEALARARERRQQLADEMPGVKVSLTSAINNMILVPESLAEAVEELLGAWDDDHGRVLDRMVWSRRMEVDVVNVPGHAHKFPGVWDDDNGSRANKPCRLCHALARVRRML